MKYTKEQIKEKNYIAHRKYRNKVIRAYGGECVCCGEKTYEFLSLDHINGDGKQHRRKVGVDMCLWIIKNNYPKSIQLLCHNCNLAKGFYKKCPHQN